MSSFFYSAVENFLTTLAFYVYFFNFFYHSQIGIFKIPLLAYFFHFENLLGILIAFEKETEMTKFVSSAKIPYTEN